MTRNPSCLISCSHWLPEGSLSVLVGRHGKMNPAGRVREPNCGLIVLPNPVTQGNRKLIIAMAARHRLPAVYAFPFFAREGGLISYGVDLPDQYRQSASYVDRILRGEKPADLPVQQPTKFALVVNLATAKALGLKIPEVLLLRADEVIE